jgi:hypothetical protein
LLYSSQIIIAELLFNVNENISAVKAFDTEPRATATGTPTALGPSNTSDLMRGTFQLTEESFLQKLPVLLLGTRASVLQILNDRLILNKEVSVTSLTTTLNGVRLDVCDFHIHHR